MNAAPDTLFLALQEAVAGRYSLERELGRGGMGIVYLARDVRLDRPVALKLLPPDRAVLPLLRERFLREARMAARLGHPNIVPIHAVEEVGAFVFYAMRYVAGETLGDRLRRLGPLPPRETARILREVAWALAYAHAQGVIHRDIKPDNILLDSDGDRAMVTDFGIARLTDEDDQSGGRVIGTPEYLSPEQAGGAAIDPRSDLYSLGAVGYHCVAGHPPFRGTIASLLAQRLTQDAPPLQTVVPSVPAALATAIDRALLRDPAARYESAEAMAEALVPVKRELPELPVPVRIWIERGREMKGLYLLWSAGWSLVLIVATIAAFSPTGSLANIVGAAFALVMGTSPWFAHGLWRIQQTRRVLEAGVTFDELRAALDGAIVRREEELRFEAARPVHWIPRVAHYLTLAALGVLLFCLVLGASGAGGGMIPFSLTMLAGMATAGGVIFGTIFPGRRPAVRDRAGRFRRWLWKTPLGTLAAKIARIGLAETTPAWAAWRPTEAALGSATEVLFEALPAAAREALRDLPRVVTRLERDAAVARECLARGADGPWEDRLAQAVAAIETLRLGLLRMTAGEERHAGSLTADLDAARQLSERIEYQVAGADAAAQFLDEAGSGSALQRSIQAVPRSRPPTTSLG